MLRKLNILLCDEDNSYYQTVHPLLGKMDIDIYNANELPLHKLGDDRFWGELRSIVNIFLGKFDYRFWYCDDSLFRMYLDLISNIRFPAIMPFEFPFGYEMPKNIPVEIFEKKLHERTKMVVDIIKSRQPETLIVSPSICAVSESMRNVYLDYFVNNRSYFDVYSLSCWYEPTEKNSVQLTSLLSETLKILPKPVWVTRWAFPSCDSVVESRKSLIQSVWKPMTSNEAAAKMGYIFRTINETIKDIRWFFTGVGQDQYDPEKTPLDLVGNFSKNIKYDVLPQWGWEHFTGMMDYNGNIKKPILKTLSTLI